MIPQSEPLLSFLSGLNETRNKGWHAVRDSNPRSAFRVAKCAPHDPLRSKNASRFEVRDSNHPQKTKRNSPTKVELFLLARRKGFEPLRSLPRCGLLRSLIRFAQKTLRVLRSVGSNHSQNERKKQPPDGDCFFLARRKGFEPLTFWSVARRSIQLS